MADERPKSSAFDGFSPFEAALRLSQALGQEAGPVKLRERIGTEPTDEDIPSLIETGEHRGRLVQINAEDIGLLILPTLVQLKDGGWILVHSKSGKKWVTERPEGLARIQLDSEHISGKAIDRLGVLPSGKNLWVRLGRLFLNHKEALIQIFAVSVLMQLLSVVSPLITRLVIDQALPQASPSLLVLAVLGVLLTTMASSALGLIRDWTGAFVETKLETIAQRGILDHALSLPFPKLMRKTASEIVQAFSGLSMARDLMGQRLFGTFMDAFTACAYLIMILSMWPRGAAIIIVLCIVLAVVAFGSGLVQSRIQRQAIPVQIAERDAMLQTLNGVATVKAAGVERRSISRWWKLYEKAQYLGLKRQRAGLWSEVGLDSIQLLVTLAVLVEGGRQVLLGNLSIGTLFAVQQMGGSLTGAVTGAVNLFVSFLVAKPQLDKAEEILSLEPEPQPPVLPVPPKLGVTLEGIWFRYAPEDAWILKELSFSVEPGGRDWLRWPSGAGKSTLLRLMGGLLEPERGQILIGGRNARDMRRHLTYVPQNIQMFGSSILENLKIFSGQAPMEKLMEASERSGLAKWVRTFPMGYETVLSQSGGNISGGQRQLILLAAAMATERKVLLLDEAFANLDWLSKSEILQGEWFEGKTVVYASHEGGI